MNPTEALRNGYDAFISHSHADKAFARELAERLAAVDFHGRALRPWLDEQFLDPGNLSQAAELTSALDRSRSLVLVLSPASVDSTWVALELAHFLRDRPHDAVVALLKSPCTMPALLGGTQPLDFSDPTRFEASFGALVERLCPPGGAGVAEAQAAVDHAWRVASDADPGGLDAEPSPARDALLAALLRFTIDDPATEGLALAGFARAARCLLDDHARDHPAAYNMKMLLGECLAVAVLRHPRCRQVAQRLLDLERAGSTAPVLAFVVARAYAKLAEIDPALVDLGALLRVVTQLDARAPPDHQQVSVAMLIGRIAAKLRGTDLGDLLIQTLSEGGALARIAAIGGISMSEALAPSVFYLSALQAMHSGAGARPGGALAPPSRKLQALLSAIDIDQPALVGRQLEIAKDDLRRAFAIDDLPYGHSWFALRRAAPAARLRHGPFIGTLAIATTANMEALALRLDASNVVCLTEPRIVEALFERAGALLVPPQDEDSPQCRRLDGRDLPYAVLDADRMAALKDGDLVEVEDERMRIVSAR